MLTKNNCVGKKKHRCRLQSNQISERVLAQISVRHGSSNKKQRFLLGIKRHVHFLMILAFCQWYCTSAMILLVVLVIIWYFHQSFCNSKISFANRISFPLGNIIVNKKESLILRLSFCLLGRGGRTRTHNLRFWRPLLYHWATPLNKITKTLYNNFNLIVKQ